MPEKIQLARVLVPLAFMLFVFGQVQSGFGATHGEGSGKVDRVGNAEKIWQKWHGDAQDALAKTDPELVRIRDNLEYGQILEQGTLGARRQALLILVTLATTQTPGEMEAQTEAALRVGAKPEEIREALYQAAPYVGFPRIAAALSHVNNVFMAKGIKTPLPSEATVNEANRFEKGFETQSGIFGGQHIKEMHEKAPEGQKSIVVDYLSAWCFGDFYTRKVLDLNMRELITFSAIVSLGGCDPQARAHAAANIAVGNTKQNLVDALATLLPYIGFPRTLNGLAAVNAAVPEPEKK